MEYDYKYELLVYKLLKYYRDTKLTEETPKPHPPFDDMKPEKRKMFNIIDVTALDKNENIIEYGQTGKPQYWLDGYVVDGIEMSIFLDSPKDCRAFARMLDDETKRNMLISFLMTAAHGFRNDY